MPKPVASNNRDVNLRIRAKDETGPGVKSAQSALERLAAAQKRTAGRRAAYAGSVQAAKDLRVAADEAAAAAQRAGERIGNAARPSKKMRDELEASRAAARAAKAEYIAAEAAVRRFTNTGFVGFDRFATSGKQAESAVRAQARAQDELTNAYRRSAAAGARAAPGGKATGLLGLRPHEMTNLGYQVNDLITQIASGTSPMQAFAQQGGQIAQIFPAATGAILRFIPVLGLAAAALSPLVAGLVKVNNEARRLKDAEDILRRSGEAATYSAPQLAALAERLENIGFKASETKDVLSVFVREAIDPTYLDGFAKSAKGLAEALGTDVASAAEKVATAFSGNLDAVLALDDELNVLTDSERGQLEVMKASGREAEGRVYAFGIFEKRFDTISGKARGPWSGSLRNLQGAFTALADYVGADDLWRGVKDQLNSVANLIERITASLPGARAKGLEALRAERDQYDAAIAAKAGQPDRRGGPGLNRSELVQRRFAVGVQIANLENDARRNALPRATDTTRDPEAPAPVRSGGSGRDRGASEAERRAEAQREFVAQLEAENAARTFSTQIMSETERQQRVLTALRAAELGASRVGLELTDLQRAAITESVAGEYDRSQAIEAGRVIEEARLRLAEQRGEVLTKEARIERDLATVRDKFGATELAVLRDLLGQQIDLEDSAARRAAADQRINDLLALRRELASSLALAEESGDTAAVAELQARIAALNTDLIAAAQNALALMAGLSGPAAEAARVAIGNLITETQRWGQAGLTTADEMNRMLTSGGVNALDQFAAGLVETGNAFESARQAFLSFASDFLRQIALMIAQRALLNALEGAGGGGGTGGVVARFVNGLFSSGGGVSVPTKHVGGLVSQGGGYRTVNPAIFADAMRFHSGGIVGLKPNEIPAILEPNEEVLTENDPRHRRNGGLSGRGGSVKIVNVFDPAEAFERGLATEAGERTLMNFFRRNSGAIKMVMG